MCSRSMLFRKTPNHLAVAILAGVALLTMPITVTAADSTSLASAAVPAVPEGLTAGEWNLMRAAVDRDQHRLHAQGETYRATNPAQGLHITFSPEGFEVTPHHVKGQWRWGLRLRAYGYGAHLEPVSRAELSVSDNRIEYRRGDLVEWYVNDRRGLEQGFTLRRRPAGPRGDAPLQLQLSPTGDLSPRLIADARGVEWRREPGKTALTYSGLHAYDATGRDLEASIEVGGGEIRLRVNDHGAVYPITVDPLIQQKKLLAGEPVIGDQFGLSVAISGDLVIVGAHSDNSVTPGAAYIFERNRGSTGNWGQAKKLVASDGLIGDKFGFSVAISGDRAIVGALTDNACSGSVYIFERGHGGEDNWGQVQRLLPASLPMSVCLFFGHSVAISGDTAVVGAPGDDERGERAGAAYLFRRDVGGPNWNQVKKLTATGRNGIGVAFAQYGFSVAISGDTALVGAPSQFILARGEAGAVYIYGRNQGETDNWGEVTRLAGTFHADQFGRSTAIDGNTILVGAPFQVSNSGRAHIFARDPGGNWGLVKVLAASGAQGVGFGLAVAISGGMAILGTHADPSQGPGSGAAYIFERDHGTANNWGETQKLVASDGLAGDHFGIGVAIDGSTAIVGAHLSVGLKGSAYVFGPAPTPPMADAGADQTVDEGTLVALDGSASQGADTYSWTQLPGRPVELIGTDTASPTFVAPLLPAGVESETLTFQLEVSNAAGSHTDTVNVTVLNVAPPGPDVTALGSARLWVGLKNSDAVGLRLDLRAVVSIDGTMVGEGELRNVASGSSNFNNAKLNAIPLDLFAAVPADGQLEIALSVRRTCFGGGHRSGTPRLWYDGRPIDSGRTREAGSRVGATIGDTPTDFFLRDGFALSTTAGSGEMFVDVEVDSDTPCPDRPFAPFGTWSLVLP